jgi:DnaK suppressor protein
LQRRIRGRIFHRDLTINKGKEDTMLTDKNKNYFKKILKKRLEELSSGNKETITHSESAKDELYDFIDQASVESDRDLNYHIKERESRLIIKIKDALERIESGDFGICEECGEEISEKRLKARPVTTLCINCKKRQEVMEKARGL